MIIKYLNILFIIFIFTSCSGGTSSSTSTSTTSTTKTAYFYDSFANGIKYTCGSDISGYTGDVNNVNGSFNYSENCDVTFSVGKVHIGSIDGKNITDKTKIYPNTLLGLSNSNSSDERVINILRFLQTIDEDNDPSNGIEISSQTTVNLQKSDTPSIDLTNINLLESDLNSTTISANPNNVLVDKINAIAHFESTLRTYVNTAIDTVAPAKPFLTNDIKSINNINTKNVTVEVNGEEGSHIFLAFSKTSNTNDLVFIDKNITIGDTKKEDLVLNFQDDTLGYFYYHIMLIDDKTHKSEYLTLKILKDVIPPSVIQNNIIIDVAEQQFFIQNINATDSSNITYRVISQTEDNRSIDHDLFTIDSTGNITFINEPNFDDLITSGKTTSFSLVVRALDEAKNMVDVFLQINLVNILDNPPKLQETNYSYCMFEGYPNNHMIFDTNTTLEHNLTLAPDNDKNLSAIKFKILNHTDKFNIDENTGKITIKDKDNDFFDYEKSSRELDINISVENDNNTSTGNTSYINLKVCIENKIDTIPSLIPPISQSINERNNPGVVTVFDVDKNVSNSDYNLSMIFSIVAGNDGNFTIDPQSGVVSTIGDSLDFETTSEYNLTIRATNNWEWDNNRSYYDEVNLNIKILNVIDNNPIIQSTIIDNILPEDTNASYLVAIISRVGVIDDENNTSNFILQSGTPFSISTNGNITTSRKLLEDYNETFDNSSITTYTLSVQSNYTSWQGVTLNSNIITFDINITNVIDNVPVLSAPNSLIEIEENNSTFTYDINISSSNFDENNITKFNIVSGDPNNNFDFNISSRKLIIRNTLDWENKKEYTLVINATNVWYDNKEHNSSTIELAIKVKNIADVPPVLSGLHNIEIHENIDKNHILLKIQPSNTIFNVELYDEQMISQDKIDVENTRLSTANSNFSLELDNNSDIPIVYLKTSTSSNFDFEVDNNYFLQLNIGNDYNTTQYDVNVSILNDIDKDLPLLVLLLEYNDINITTSLSDVQNKIFEEETTGSQYLNNYFSRVSKNKFSFSAASETYDNDTNGIIKVKVNDTHPTNNPVALKNDIKEALILADAYIDFSTYDTKNIDGNISKDELAILVLVAGGEKTFGDTNQSILAASYKVDLNQTLDNVDINTSYVVVGELQGLETIKIGLIAKKLSNTILDFKENESFGNFGLMGNGDSANDENGSLPIHPSAYNKILQGWVTPKILSKGDNNIIFNYANDTINYNTFRINTSSSSIYYILEYRDVSAVDPSINNYDDGLYYINNSSFSGGLIIWKVDTVNNSVNLLEISNPTNPNSNTEGYVIKEGINSDYLPTTEKSIFSFDPGSIDNTNHTFTIKITVL
ncbi:MAG TPA: hypothetical protein EYG73_07485 [Arcobacter sp.]|nr:hypothetical protein [Arcobacter sp.]